MTPIAGIATSGLRAAALGMQAAAHNIANLATPDAMRQKVVLSAGPTGGVSAAVVEAPPIRPRRSRTWPPR
ncbi:hypothetical protein MUU75_16955 [Pseudoxanthomonas mexicana]|uniref:hypothetical protein n=1 Tax=Pseudoxanthomonas mexicana TaxID=128785 RepID=UPI001FD6494C|nr:hypothetical protein [Pseudoxanthomonas mexicana]UOV04753.1 hypothetical protein MUU75_16955 [Pseudoxanthomonas mexicana]